VKEGYRLSACFVGNVGDTPTYSDVILNGCYNEKTIKIALNNMVNDGKLLKNGDEYYTFL
jgi:hypothetical protein